MCLGFVCVQAETCLWCCLPVRALSVLVLCGVVFQLGLCVLGLVGDIVVVYVVSGQICVCVVWNIVQMTVTIKISPICMYPWLNVACISYRVLGNSTRIICSCKRRMSVWYFENNFMILIKQMNLLTIILFLY